MHLIDINGSNITLSADSILINELGCSLAEAIEQRLIQVPLSVEEKLDGVIGLNALIKDVIVNVAEDGGCIRAEGGYKDEVLVITLYNIKGTDGKSLTFDDLTTEQKEALRGKEGAALRFEDLTDAQKEELRGADGKSLTFYDLTQAQKDELKGKPGKDAEVTDMSEMNDKKAPSVSSVINYVNSHSSKPIAQGENVTIKEVNGKLVISASLPVGTATTADAVAYGSGTVKDKLDELSAGASAGIVTMYVSQDGNDARNGLTFATSKATVNAALSAGASVVIVSEGNYNEIINLANAKLDAVTIKGERGGRVIFRSPNNLLFNDGAETAVGGYDNVMQHECTLGNYTGWLYMDNLDDAMTKIINTERHPSQRGKFYRCESTRFEMSEKTTINEALADISKSAQPKWYYADGILYFKKVGDSSVYPMYKCEGFVLRTDNASCKNKSLTMSNIEMRYGSCYLSNLNLVHLENCAAKYVYGAGAVRYDNCISATLVNCEASSCHSSAGNATGDGFNAHGSTLTNYGAKCVTIRLVNCWSHDNKDDGYSDHEFSETCVDGGLYEYNGKAGITPAYGSHCTVSNVMCRKNYAGIYYTGSVSSGANGGDHGNGGQIICYNCVTSENNRGTGARAIHCGYAVGGDNADNTMLLVNCIAQKESIGYKCYKGNTLIAYDCSESNCTLKTDGEINSITTNKI